MPLTANDLRALADQAEAEAIALARDGDVHRAALQIVQAQRLRATAEEVERLTGLDRRSADVQAVHVTAAQLARRGRAVAKAHAHNVLLYAISESEWGSARIYARRRLKIAPSSLTGYMDGSRPCPRSVDEKVRQDFPGLKWQWPRGVVD